tara:strand:- start:28 stop:558 length:531 start_codon:yes stop_codon:yes gene_type:complete
MFKNEYIKFRVIKKNDLDKLIDLRNETSTWQSLKNINLLDYSNQLDWHKSLKNNESKKYFIIENLNSKFLGLIRMDEIDYINKTIRIGCDIVITERNKGYASKTYDLMFDYCFNFLNMNKVWLEVAIFNKNAIRLYFKKGFLKEGLIRKNIFRNGRYYDSLMMGLLKNEYKRFLNK